jgi:hypothetical protein
LTHFSYTGIARCGGTKLKTDCIVVLSDDGKTAQLIDNFESESVVWGHGGVRHYGIKIKKA